MSDLVKTFEDWATLIDQDHPELAWVSAGIRNRIKKHRDATSAALPPPDATMRLDLTTEEASLISGALNVCSQLRNTLAPVTTEQLDIGTKEREIGWRVLNTIAVSDLVDAAQPQLEQLAEAARVFVEQWDGPAASADEYETLKSALAATGRYPISSLGAAKRQPR